VRPGADWCSLCYQDLRTPSRLVTASSAPLVEASVEPGPVRWAELRAWHGGVEEAELSPDARPEARLGVAGEVSPTAPAVAEPSKASPAADLRWPCACGSHVEFDQDACPVCGSAFLGDLRGEASGRHRVGSAGGMLAHQWSTSRTFRFVAAGAIALFIAVGVPLMLALLG
jgi:hypothetical protein